MNREDYWRDEALAERTEVFRLQGKLKKHMWHLYALAVAALALGFALGVCF